jgi:hypothetical protein
MKWTIIVFAFLIVIGIVACAVAVGSSDDTQDAVDVLSDEPGTVTVDAPVRRCWSGAFGDRTVEGCGPRTVEIDEDIIVANAQKQTPGRWRLSLTLTVGGEVKDESETTAEFGIAQVAEG